jgi:hypothetical protein
MFAVALAGGVVLMVEQLTTPGWFCLVLASLIALGALRSR